MTTTIPAAGPRLRFGPTVGAVAAASALLPIAVTGAAVALPAMATDLGASPSAAQWVLNGFNIGFSALPLPAGAVADRFGRRRVLQIGITLVGAMALLTALAPAMEWAIAARVVQGCGAAAVLASGAAVLANATDGRRRRLAFGLLGTAFGSGLALGPLLAGTLTGAWGWRAVFLLIAVASVPAVVGVRFAPESRDAQAPPIDPAGALTFTAGLAALSFAFVHAAAAGWGDPWTVALLAAFVVLVLAFAVIEMRLRGRAMFDVRLFRRPEFVAVVCQPFTVTLGFVILLIYLPAYLQGVGGRTPLESGLLLLPLTLPVLVLPLTGGALAGRWSVRAVLTTASLFIVAGALLLLTLDPGAGWAALALPLLPFGIGVGLAFGVMDNAAVGTVPLAQAGAAAGIFNTMRITGESMAVAGAAALLTTLAGSGLTPGASGLAGAAVQGHIDAGHREVIVAGLTGAFHVVGIILAVLSLVGAVLTYLALRPNRALR